MSFRTIQLQDEERNDELRDAVLSMIKDAYEGMPMPEGDDLFVVVPGQGMIQVAVAHSIHTKSDGEEVIAFRMFQVTDHGETYEVREMQPPFMIIEPRGEN